MGDKKDLNVFGEAIVECSIQPLTGFFRDGCCNSDESDRAEHTVCAVMTNEFLEYSRQRGNDLITPIPRIGFTGLKQGDHWCICATRWIEAYEAGVAPKVYLEATNETLLNHVPLEELIKYAVKK
jgi:hypothetical protein